jgi:D-serine deaminase-like pyridoxal phosphate-dependent protein
VTAAPTPYLAVDLGVLDRNIARMAGSGVAVRPHVKTHKCVEIARRQLAAGATGITVATVAEAEVFVAAGCTDVFIAYPLWVDAARGVRLRSLAERASVRIGVESVEGAQAAARWGGPLEVLVEVDSGHHRTGVVPSRAGEVAAAAARAGLGVRGVFTFPGHGYGVGSAAEAATDESTSLSQAASAVRSAGLQVDVLSGGSTPTASLADTSVLTELRPGVYVFNDAQQLELGSCAAGEVALTTAATVISRGPDRVVLDAGSKVLGADRPGWVTGFGRLLDHLDARITALSEHHATVEFRPGSVLPELGSAVRVVPNHVCNAVNLADELVVVSEGSVVDRWRVAARGANT